MLTVGRTTVSSVVVTRFVRPNHHTLQPFCGNILTSYCFHVCYWERTVTIFSITSWTEHRTASKWTLWWHYFGNCCFQSQDWTLKLGPKKSQLVKLKLLMKTIWAPELLELLSEPCVENLILSTKSLKPFNRQSQWSWHRFCLLCISFFYISIESVHRLNSLHWLNCVPVKVEMHHFDPPDGYLGRFWACWVEQALARHDWSTLDPHLCNYKFQCYHH